MNPDELIKIEIYQWNDIKDRFNNPDLLLGNGFSIMLSNRFSYNSLFDKFLEKLSKEYIDIFKMFNTPNFEYILNNLLIMKRVLQKLQIPIKPIEKLIANLKNGLILSIKETHPLYNIIDKRKLEEISIKLNIFNNIFTINYDLFLYHINMISKDLYKKDKKYRPYNDYFWGNSKKKHYKQFVNYQNYPEYKHIYYLHGALFIYETSRINYKVIRKYESEELIELITKRIEHGLFPLFVTEGNADDKSKYINNSKYLRFCLEQLKLSNSDKLIYGCSLSEMDKHLIDIIKHSSPNLIYAIYDYNKTAEEIQNEKIRIKLLLTNTDNSNNIIFVDAKSIFNI